MELPGHFKTVDDVATTIARALKGFEPMSPDSALLKIREAFKLDAGKTDPGA